MAHIVVVGNTAIDRIWWLDQPLAPGARLTCRGIEERHGGGGYLTGFALLALGHRVTLVTRIGDDAKGVALRKHLENCGFDLSHAPAPRGSTASGDILVEPSGERTLIATRAGLPPLLEVLPECDADAVYLNVKRMAPSLAARLAAFSLGISQHPLVDGERRPVKVIIASRSDVEGHTAKELFAGAEAIASPCLETLFVTDGPGDIITADRSTSFSTPAEPVSGLNSTIGAGDFFAAGVIDALLRAMPKQQVAAYASRCAAHFLSVFGRRPPNLGDGGEISGVARDVGAHDDPVAMRPEFAAR